MTLYYGRIESEIIYDFMPDNSLQKYNTLSACF